METATPLRQIPKYTLPEFQAEADRIFKDKKGRPVEWLPISDFCPKAGMSRQRAKALHVAGYLTLRLVIPNCYCKWEVSKESYVDFLKSSVLKVIII